jgi:transglutaminase-like putative cysteine protease
MKKFILILYLLLPVSLLAQNYPIGLIPDSLFKKANVVQRLEETRIIIHSTSAATVLHKVAYTVLNEKGNSFAEYDAVYDDLDHLTDVSGKLYDAMGNKIKSLKKKDIKDVAYDDQFSLISDARIKHHDFYCRTYPYTVEYEEEWEYKGIYEFPSWYPITASNCALQKSIFVVEMPLDYQLRYSLLNAAKEPVITSTAKIKILQWEASNMPAFEYEPFQPPVTSLVPAVLVGPSDFEYGGYKGNLSTWANYGKYYASLYKGRDELPSSIKAVVHQLTDDVRDQDQKIKILYDFLQKNTHYISIQLGIGGLQPFEASFVAEKKYGDCKALSNYMVSLLKEAGIKANNVIIYGGTTPKKVIDNFPKHYFNHVVVCVPGPKDTMWLECTSQTESAGYAGSFTGNRKALMVTEDGGQLVSTPRYSAYDNLQIRKIEASIAENGDLVAESFTHSTGLQQELQHRLMNDANPEQREKYLNKALNLPTYKVEKIVYKEIKAKLPAMDEYLKIFSQGYASVSGKRLFVQPDLFNKGYKLPKNDHRLFNIEFTTAYRDIDSVFITIPAGYVSESMPKDVHISNKFGSYDISFTMEDNVIKLVRVSQQNEAIFPATDYNELLAFFDIIYKADRSNMVFVRKEG